MKRLLCLAMLVMLCVSLSACGQSEQSGTDSEDKKELYKVVSEYEVNKNGIKMTAEYDAHGSLLAVYDTDNPSIKYGEEEYKQRSIVCKNTGYDEDGKVLWYAVFYDKEDEYTGEIRRVSDVYNAEGELQNIIPEEEKKTEAREGDAK